RDVFPIMATRRQLYGYGFQGLWVDTGKPDDYFLANKLMLDRIAHNSPILEKDAKVNSNAKVIPPSIIGKRVNIGEDSVIGPYAAIGDDVTIGKGIRIQNAIIFPKAWIEKHSSINGAVIGEGALVGRWVKIEGYCIIGDYVVIDDNLTLTQHVKICHNKEVKESIFTPTTIM
ncbi:MAG: GlgC family sugar phosphate nucleotidyltransferase, partial [Candidatus Ranarchaeia archaeon]